MWTCGLTHRRLRLCRTSPAHHCLHSVVRSSLPCLSLFPDWLTPKDSKKQVKFKLEFSLEIIQLLRYSEQLGHCYFGLQWVKPVLVDPSSVACHTNWQKWACTMSFLSHDLPHFYSLTGFHGSIWIIQLKKNLLLFYSHSVLQMCKHIMGFGCQPGFHFLFIDLPPVKWVPSGPDAGLT